MKGAKVEAEADSKAVDLSPTPKEIIHIGMVCCDKGMIFPHGEYLVFHCEVHELRLCIGKEGVINMNAHGSC